MVIYRYIIFSAIITIFSHQFLSIFTNSCLFLYLVILLSPMYNKG